MRDGRAFSVCVCACPAQRAAPDATRAGYCTMYCTMYWRSNYTMYWQSNCTMYWRSDCTMYWRAVHGARGLARAWGHGREGRRRPARAAGGHLPRHRAVQDAAAVVVVLRGSAVAVHISKILAVVVRRGVYTNRYSELAPLQVVVDSNIVRWAATTTCGGGFTREVRRRVHKYNNTTTTPQQEHRDDRPPR